METNAYLALGANIGDPRESLRNAVRLLNGSGLQIVRASSIYRTKPVGVVDQPDFLNAVIEVKTTLSPSELLRLCLKIEETLGRKRTIRWGPRVIDIDILLYGDLVVSENDLVVPHPRMMERAFVLVPLAEIAPDARLAGGITSAAAAQRVDQEGMEKLEGSSWIE